ncbi:TPA: phosphodiester glycosidase family protein, partial [Enterococcus faecium]
YTFNGGEIKPKVRLTSSSVDSGNPKSVLDYITNHDAMCCINAGVFDVTSGIVDGRLIIDGAIQKDSAPVIHKNQWTLGIKSDGSLSAYDSTISASAMLQDDCESAVTGFVPIIMDGSMVDKSLFLTYGHLTQPNPRQVICQTALGDYFVFSCDGRKDDEKGLTLEQIGEILLLFGVTFAYNLDGGGSTQTFVKKKRINRLIENRPIPSIIVFE